MSDDELAGEQPTDWSPLLSAVRTIAQREGTDPTDLTPLQESIDADAVEALIDGADDSVTLTFTHLGHEVVVRGDGTVRVDSPNRQAAALEA